MWKHFHFGKEPTDQTSCYEKGRKQLEFTVLHWNREWGQKKNTRGRGTISQRPHTGGWSTFCPPLDTKLETRPDKTFCKKVQWLLPYSRELWLGFTRIVMFFAIYWWPYFSIFPHQWLVRSLAFFVMPIVWSGRSCKRVYLHAGRVQYAVSLDMCVYMRKECIMKLLSFRFSSLDT